jgi:phospholipid-translocating ATPase
MYYDVYDTPFLPKTRNISDHLGQIEYIFSDKTGTLTQNIMEFQQYSIGGAIYYEGVTKAQRGCATREGRDIPDNGELKIELKCEMLAKWKERSRIDIVNWTSSPS